VLLSLIRKYRLILACPFVATLTGCIPEDTFLLLKYAPDGQLIALVSEKKGLVVADPAGMETRQLATGPIDPYRVEWTPDSLRLVYANWIDGSLDVYASSLDGMTTRITNLPSRECSPMIANNTLIYLTTESGIAELTTASLGPIQNPVKLSPWDMPVVQPVISSSGNYIAWISMEDLRPQVFYMDLRTGVLNQLTAEKEPLSLLAGPLVWTPDESGVGYIRNVHLRDLEEQNDSSFASSDRGTHHAATGTDFFIKPLDQAKPEKFIVHEDHGLRNPQFLRDGSLTYASSHALKIVAPDGTKRELSLDLPAGTPTPGGDNGEIAFVAADQLVGVTTASLERARILTFDLEDKFLLAEEYFRSGSQAKSYDLYEELASSVQRTRDPQMARLVYISNLRRLGRTDQAVAEIEKLIAEEQFKGQVPEKFLWRLLGFSYLLELNDFGKAEASFSRYDELTSDTRDLEEPESATNALHIIRETSPSITTLYAQAVKARLNGNFLETDRLFGQLLTSAPLVLAIQREYLNALEGFDREVYYFSPTQRPFKPSKFQQAEYLERLVELAPVSPVAREARLELFLLRIEMGSYSRARTLLNEALTSGSDQGRPDGILEVFRNYLETPEPQPWINQAIPEVFLHETIRPKLEKAIESPEDRLLLGVVATKMALLQGKPDAARREADTALAAWNQIERADQTGDAAALYSRLLVLRAREAELRGLYSEAAEVYMDALQVLAERHLDNFEFQEEIAFRAGLLKVLVNEHPEGLELMKSQELLTGCELVNPTWEPEPLRAAVVRLATAYDSSTSTLKLWAAYESGVVFGKLQRDAQARSAFLTAAAPSAPEFLRRKATLELAALDEVGDPWNAGRWYAQIAALPSTRAEVKLWCSFQIARLHLSINYKVSAAREALALVVSNAPDTPLAIQAQELLVSTSNR